MNEKPPHHSRLPNSPFLNAAESWTLPQPADTTPNISPASGLPFSFSTYAIVSSLFAFVQKRRAFLPQRQGHNSVCRAECDLSLLLSPKESIFHWRQGLCTQREGDKHIGGKICSVNENGEFCCRNLQASRSLLSWLKPVGLLHKFSCWVLAVRELPHAGRSAVNPSRLFGQDKNHH